MPNFPGVLGLGGLINSNLKLILNYPTTANTTKAYTNISQTGSGTSGTKIITASSSVANIVQAGEKIRIKGTDIYTVSSVSTVTINTVETLTSTYISAALALDKITTWRDDSGYGHSPTQATAASKPVFNPAKLNGLNAVTFDGTASVLASASFGGALTQPNTIYAVAKYNFEQASYIFDGIAAGNRQASFTNGTAHLYSGFAGSQINSGAILNLSPHIHTVVFNTTSSVYYLDNASIATGDVGSHSMSGVTLGARYTAADNFLNGDIYKFIIYNAAHTAAQVAHNNKILALETGIAIS